MKLLVTSDWHLDWTTHGVARYGELRDVLLDVVLQQAQIHKVDAFCFLGDLSDPDSGPVVFRAVETAIYLSRRLSEYGIEQVWLAGNHDVVEDGTGTTTLTPLSALAGDLVHVCERPAKVALKCGLTVVTLPFVATSHAYDPEAWVVGSLAGRKPGSKYAVAGHLSVPGVVPGEEVTEMPRGRDIRFPIEACAGVDLLMNGHIHRQQQTESGIWIPGSLARLTFGEEEHDPGFLIVEV